MMRPSPLLAALLLTSEVKSHLHSGVSYETKVRDAREQRRQRWTQYNSAVMNRRYRGRRQDVPADAAMLSNIVGSIADDTVVAPLDSTLGGNEPPVADIPQGPQEVDLPAVPAVIDAGTIGHLPAEEPDVELPLAELPGEVLPEEEAPEEEAPEEEVLEVGDDGPDGGLIGDLNDGILSPEGQNIADILLGNGKTNEENFEIGTRPGFDDHTGCDGNDPCCRWYYISKDLTAVFHNADGTCNSLARQSIRMGFHDAGTWSAKLAASGKKNGGADGSLVLFGEMSRPENFGMEGAVSLASRLYHTYNVTMADLIQYMANHAVVSCPLGPRVRTYVGRKDATEAAPEGLLPSVHAPADELIALFADKTISAHELTALMGAHSTSTQSNVDASKAGFPQDTTPGVWDVNYYNETLDATENGCIFKLESDVKLSKHPAMAAEWQKFVGGQAHWNADYAKAYLRLSLLGVNNINELKECTLALPAQQATVPKDADIDISGKCTASSSSSLVSSSTMTTPNTTSSVLAITTDNPVSATGIPNMNQTSTSSETLPSSENSFSTLSEPLALAPETSSVLLPSSTTSLEEAVPSSDTATPEKTSLLLVSGIFASFVETTTVNDALETSLMSNSPISVTLTIAGDAVSTTTENPMFSSVTTAIDSASETHLISNSSVSVTPTSTGDVVSTTTEIPISASEALTSTVIIVTKSQQQTDGIPTTDMYFSEATLRSNSLMVVTPTVTGDAVGTTTEIPISAPEALASIGPIATESQQQVDGLSTTVTYFPSLEAPRTVTPAPIETSTTASPSSLLETTTESNYDTPTSSDSAILPSSGLAIEISSTATSHSWSEVAESSAAIPSASISEPTLSNTIQDITTSSPTRTQASSASLVSNQITSSVSNLDLSTYSVPISAISTDELSTPTNDPLSGLATQNSSGSILSPSNTSTYTSTSYEAAMPTETTLSTQLLQLGVIGTSSSPPSIIPTASILASSATIMADNVSTPRSQISSIASSSQRIVLTSSSSSMAVTSASTSTSSLLKTIQSSGPSPFSASQSLPHSTALSGTSSTATVSSRTGSSWASTRGMTSTSKPSSRLTRSRKFTMTTLTRPTGTSGRISSSGSIGKMSATISKISSSVAKTLATTKISISTSKAAKTKPIPDRATIRSSTSVTKLFTLLQLSKPQSPSSTNIPSTTKSVPASKSASARKTSSSSSRALAASTHYLSTKTKCSSTKSTAIKETSRTLDKLIETKAGSRPTSCTVSRQTPNSSSGSFTSIKTTSRPATSLARSTAPASKASTPKAIQNPTISKSSSSVPSSPPASRSSTRATPLQSSATPKSSAPALGLSSSYSMRKSSYASSSSKQAGAAIFSTPKSASASKPTPPTSSSAACSKISVSTSGTYTASMRCWSTSSASATTTRKL